MRHGKKFNHLSRKKGHRRALLRNMSISLIKHKRIKTTVAKAKALRKYLEPIMTRAKKVNDAEKIKQGAHHTRVIYRYLQNNEAVKTLCGEVAEKIADRPGGYLRILRTGFRPKDAAEMCIIEMVDYNEAALESKTDKKKKRRRRRRRRKKKSTNVDNNNNNNNTEDNEDAVQDNEDAVNEEE